MAQQWRTKWFFGLEPVKIKSNLAVQTPHWVDIYQQLLVIVVEEVQVVEVIQEEVQVLQVEVEVQGQPMRHSLPEDCLENYVSQSCRV